MNLETIQSKLSDIEQIRNISTENEAALMKWQGRKGTESIENSNSSLSFRFILALFILAFLIYADYQKLPYSGELLTKVKDAISYDIKLENIEKLENIWYTISNVISFPSQDTNNEEEKETETINAESINEKG